MDRMDPQRGQVEAKLTQDGSKFVHVAWRCPRAAQDVPKMGQDDTKVAPRRPKRAPRWPQEGPRWHQKSPKRAQDEAKMAQHRARQSKLMPIRPKVQNHKSLKNIRNIKVLEGSGAPREAPNEAKMALRWV